MRTVSFERGIHPPEWKEATRDKPIVQAPLPEEVVIPLSQHAGAPTTPLVAVGDRVKTGMKIGASEALISAPVHASVSGEVKAIGPYPHPLGTKVQSVVIASDGKDEWEKGEAVPDFHSLPPAEIRKRVREAGIVGLGGAAFPTAVKLTPPAGKTIDTFILNGAECEPYLSADHRLMLEHADEILEGMAIIMYTLGVKRGIVAIEANKEDAITLMQEKVGAREGWEVVRLQTKYPQGGEKQLIKAILGREVPSGGLPLDVGVVVNNVGTALAGREAIREGKPLVKRVLTVTGPRVGNPQNLRVRIGTRFREILAGAEADMGEGVRLVMGGPMMGIAQHTAEVPVIKGTSGILVLDPDDVFFAEPLACIRCGFCVDHCPVGLTPCDIGSFVENNLFPAAEELGIFDCMECGSCAYVCPARRHLVHLMKFGKAELIRQRKKKQ